MADFNDLPDQDAAPLLRAKLYLILAYFEQTMIELSYRRSGREAEANNAAVNFCSMESEIGLTRGEYLNGRSAADLDADANRIIDQMNAGKTFQGLSLKSTGEKPGEYYFCDNMGKRLFKVVAL